FARGVQRDRKNRSVVFRSRHHFRLAVDRAAARENQLLRSREAHRFEEVVGDKRAALEIEVGVLRPEADVAVGRQMPDQIRFDLLEKLGDTLPMQQIEFVKTKLGIARRALDELTLAEKKVVDAVDFVAAFEKSGKQIRRDET